MIEVIPNWHPIFVHFTVALLSIAVILFVATRFVGNEQLRRQWEVVAQWNLWLGAIITLLTVAMGVVAYNTVAHDTPSHAAMTDHRNWALITTVLFLLLAGWSALRARAGKGINTLILVGLLVGAGLLLSTAWRGGEIVYRYGLGVMSLPKADNHGHAGGEHEHAGVGHDSMPVQSQHNSLDGHDDDHGHGKSHKDDVENCELPESKSAHTVGHTVGHSAGHSADDGSHGHAKDDSDAHDHESKPAKSNSHHDDGHSDHKH